MQVIRSKRKVGGSCDMGERTVLYRVLMGRSVGKRPLGSPRYRESEMLKLILKKQDGRAWTGISWLRIGTNGLL
jgi:hypothetical protein